MPRGYSTGFVYQAHLQQIVYVRSGMYSEIKSLEEEEVEECRMFILGRIFRSIYI